MNLSPETSASLLLRVRDPADQVAWNEFVEIYEPLILRLARNKGLQEADARDVAQQVLWSVSKAIEERGHDPNQAKFRTWLHRVAHNATLNVLTRRKPDRGSGDTGLQDLLNQHSSPEGPESELIRLEYKREVFRWATKKARKEFQESTWQAFWLTAIEDRTVEEVARELNKNPGSIYAARSRIMRKIQELVLEYEQ